MIKQFQDDMTGEKDSSFNFLSSVLSFSLWLIYSLSFSCQAVGSTSQYHPSYFTSSAKFFKTHLWTSFWFHSFSFFRTEKALVASLRRRSFTWVFLKRNRCLARSTKEFERNGKDIMCFLITAWLFSPKAKREIMESRLITLHTQAHSLHLFV